MITHQPDIKQAQESTRNNSHNWEELYNNYAAIMYGVIYHITQDKKTAENIFTEAFCGLKNDFEAGQTPVAFYLWKYAAKKAMEHLRNQNLPLPELKPSGNMDKTFLSKLISLPYSFRTTSERSVRPGFLQSRLALHRKKSEENGEKSIG